jgi:hypothetical protein
MDYSFSRLLEWGFAIKVPAFLTINCRTGGRRFSGLRKLHKTILNYQKRTVEFLFDGCFDRGISLARLTNVARSKREGEESWCKREGMLR